MLTGAGNDFRTHFEGLGFEVGGQYPEPMRARYRSLEFALSFDESARTGYFAVVSIQRTAPAAPALDAMLRAKPESSLTAGASEPDPVEDKRREIRNAQETLAGPGPELEFVVEESTIVNLGRDIRVPWGLVNYPTFGDLLRARFG